MPATVSTCLPPSFSSFRWPFLFRFLVDRFQSSFSSVFLLFHLFVCRQSKEIWLFLVCAHCIWILRCCFCGCCVDWESRGNHLSLHVIIFMILFIFWLLYIVLDCLFTFACFDVFIFVQDLTTTAADNKTAAPAFYTPQMLVSFISFDSISSSPTMCWSYYLCL